MMNATPSKELLVRHADLVNDGQLHRGLKGVLVDETKVCEIDDINSRLRYRGYDTLELCAHATFEDVLHLLLWGELPTAAQRLENNAGLIEARRLPQGAIDIIAGLPPEAPAMATLRTAISALGCIEGSGDLRPASLRRAALRIAGQIPAILSALLARRNPSQPRLPLGEGAHGDFVLRALTNRTPDAEEARAMDQVLTIHADHEFNASCFAARVSISTLSDLHGAISAAIGTLSGSLHGGANERVLELVRRFRNPDEIERHVEVALGRKEKIPGFGQRGCRHEDPRAGALRDMAFKLAAKRGTTAQFSLFSTLNEVMRRRTTLWPNVDFYSASVLDSLGVPSDMFTPVFVCSRVVGWCAHVIEQVSDNVIIRPKGLYTGERYRPVPLER